MPSRALATPLTLAATLVLASALTACGSDDGSTASASTTSCDYPTGGQSAAKPVDPPSSDAPDSGEVAVDFATDQGDFTATLNAAAAPCTVNSFVSLADQGYFDDTSCHRLTTQGIYVVQCGDPTGTGGGGPGYTVPDEYDGSEKYPAGTLAMANTGQPDTGGSQFFMVYRDTDLPPQYTVFGTVDADGLAALEKVAKGGVGQEVFGPGDGVPAVPLTFTSVTPRQQ
ncbi:peptidylprolyl isomerase [Nocardioides acrostichi]|uniref:Peptidylprolyl isomerase n=1 Tax=Nocardioides acrostichi TaxID=2784339 RepID=A0A930Y7T1_9ACTN|nr:peptidylprolyl isomerase [Nocardioides acrostichi]MBF4163760.1 peptidylprolyl isomerase [Nocardioides acrostichi]